MKKELGKLRRAELLELLLEQTKETERLEKELAGAKEQLRCRGRESRGKAYRRKAHGGWGAEGVKETIGKL